MENEGKAIENGVLCFGRQVDIKTQALLWGQVNLLVEWNLKNIEIEPEQVRKNIETVCSVLNFLD